MRITSRLLISLMIAVASVASVFSYIQVRQERQRQQEELQRRSGLLAEGLQDTVESLLEKSSAERLQRLVERFGNRERLEGVAVYDPAGTPLAATGRLAPGIQTAPKAVQDALEQGSPVGRFQPVGRKDMHVYALPLGTREKPLGALAIYHDAAYIQARLSRLWRENFLRLLIQMALISLVTLVFLRWSVMGPARRMADWMKRLRAGEAAEPPPLPGGDLFGPIAREVSTFARHLTDARAAAETEARLRRTAEALWTPERLKEHVRAKLRGKPLVVVSNREPYMHVYRGRQIECMVPAGGLVTALDPVLRSSDGLWIAHGSGDADWETVDEKNRIRVPPEDPLYTLRRVSLNKEEENGYYYGFSNEGLWPLCHIAHARPLFRAEDWAQYKNVNQKFADAVLEEIAGMEEPCVLIQDYHFALLPRLVKEKRPDARIAIFWHIPWPNPETFGICPWQREILTGMLGADLIGFHIQFHCNNFLDTVDRALESRIDWERFAVNREGRSTLVRPFPISVSFPAAFQDADIPADSGPGKTALLKELGIKADLMAVGVERIDYTKGLLERFQAVERFLEKYPAYQGRFTLVQIGAPSRTHIKRYHDFHAEVEAEAERINWKFKTKAWRPIVFLKKHHSHREILPYYRGADVCLVTSLHDGMNLVAKEFVAARNDEGGALVLSRFAGASRELRDALLVNPYDIERTADALRYALEMDPQEKSSRMRKMRETVSEHNIYRWAGLLIDELTRVPAASGGRSGAPLAPPASPSPRI